MSKRIGVMGGSFDPPHFGHLVVAQDALEVLGLSGVVFVPAARPPHKLHLSQSSALDRLEMTRLAVSDDARFSVSDMEIRRGGVSYTLDTVKALRRERPDVDWVLVVGADTLLDLHNWYRIDELLGLCEVATLLRPGEGSVREIEEKVRVAEPHRRRLLENVFQVHLVGISSTEIRERVAAGRSIRYLVPQAVEDYIVQRGLYRPGEEENG